MKDIKISIIVPVYNAENYIGRAIDSVFQQNYSNWEMILINDGSTDQSEKICQRYMRDERVILMSQENEGVCSARNCGISKATGDVIVFLDADDFFCANAFEIIAQQWEDSVDFVLFGYNEVHEGGRTVKKTVSYLVDVDYAKTRKNVQLLMCQTNDFGGPWGKAFSRRLLMDYHVTFVDEIFLNEDRLFNLEYLKRIKNVKCVDEKIYNYCLNQDSVTSKIFMIEHARVVENCTACCEYLLEVYDDAVDQEIVSAFNLMCIKMILWWLPSVSDVDGRKLGERFCYCHGTQIKYSEIPLRTFSDKIIIQLCCRKKFIILRWVIGIRKKMKTMLHQR